MAPHVQFRDTARTKWSKPGSGSCRALLGVLALVGAGLDGALLRSAGERRAGAAGAPAVAPSRGFGKTAIVFIRGGGRCAGVGRLYLWDLSCLRPPKSFRARVAGTGFVVAPGSAGHQSSCGRALVRRPGSLAAALRQGGSPVLEKLVAYFPGSPLPVALETAVVAAHGDLAVLRLEATAFTNQLRPLTLCPTRRMWASR
jgi:hypothetical protein